ncbi:hypothetical protein LTS18_001908, partial [Coniosporium uncinatum]
MLNLFINSLVPSPSSVLFEALELDPIPLQPPVQVIDRDNKSNDTGLFSALSSYVSSFANDEPPEPSDQEIDYTLCTIDYITDCKFNEVFENIRDMPIDALKALMASLLAQIPENDGQPPVIGVKPELPAPTPIRPNGPKPQLKVPTYDPMLVFVLEFATILALRDEETVATLGKDVADALQTVVRDASNLHYVTVSRAVYYLLRLLRASDDHEFIRAPVVLHQISSFSTKILSRIAPSLLLGLQSCIRGPSGLRNEMATSPDFWSILNHLQALPTVAPTILEIATDLATSAPAGITVDNYES